MKQLDSKWREGIQMPRFLKVLEFQSQLSDIIKLHRKIMKLKEIQNYQQNILIKFVN